MMKTHSKKSSRAIKRAVAFGMSFALAMSTLAVAPNADAAKKKVPKLTAKKKTLYVNKAGKKTYTLKVKKNGVKKITKTTWKTSKKSVVAISKKKNTSVKLTAKKTGKATITAKVKYTVKGSSKVKTKKLKLSVTVKKAATVTTAPTKAPTVAPTTAPTVAPTKAPTTAPTAAPTVAPTTAPTATVAPTKAPTTAPTATAEPTATPAAAPVNVVSASDITKDGNNFFVALTIAEADAKAEALADTKITLTNEAAKITVNAAFSEFKDGKATYKVDEAGVKALTPGNTTANGTYVVTTADAAKLIISDIAVAYEEALAGNAVEGYVLTTGTGGNASKFVTPVEGAVVQVEGGQSVRTDANGYYKVPSVTGRKMLTVTKDGFVTKYLTGAKRVYVNKSHVTSQNIALDKYDVTKLGINVTVNDDAAKTAVKDAKVTLKNAAGTVLAEGTTSATGEITFGNNNYSKKIATDKTAADASKNYLAQGKYTLEVSKLLSKTNVDQVYEMKSFEFTLADDYENAKTVEITKTAALKSFEVTQNLKEKAEGAYADGGKIKATYKLYTKVHGNSVSDPIIDATAEVESGAISASKTAVTSIFDALKTKANVQALTLPTGDYYLMVSPKAVGSGFTGAIGVYKVSITAGSDVKTTVDITEGNVRTINSQMTLPNAVAGEVQTNASSNLEAVKWDATNKVFKDGTALASAAPWNTTVINASYTIKQVVEDGVEIQIGSSSVDYAKGADGAYASSTKFESFLGTGTYTITSVGDYSVAVDAQKEVINNDKGTVNFSKIAGAANVVETVIKVTKDSALVDVDTANVPKLTKVVAYDASGAVKGTMDYTKAAVNKSAVTAVSTKLAENDTITYTVDAKKMNLPAGTYTFGITLDGYKEVKTDSVTVNPIEKVGLTVAKKIEKATADANAILGQVKLVNENGKGYQELDNTSVKVTNGTAVLLTADKKIAAIDTLKWDGTNKVYTFEFVDKANNGMYTVAAGTYKLVVRAANTETFVKDIVVADGKQVTESVDLVPGALGEIKAFALDTNNNLMSSDWIAIALAFDEYYVNPTNENNFATGSSKVDPATLATLKSSFATGQGDTFAFGDGSFGAYLTASTRESNASYSYTENGVKMPGYYVFQKLPAGNYKVNVGCNGYTAGGTDFKGIDSPYSPKYEYKNESVAISDIGNIVKAEWAYAKVGDTASEISVPLTIKLSNGAADAFTPTTDKPYVVVIEPVKGAGTKTTVKVATAAADLNQIAVTGKTEYKVTVYTYEGNQVASATINTERAAATVEVSVNGSDID